MTLNHLHLALAALLASALFIAPACGDEGAEDTTTDSSTSESTESDAERSASTDTTASSEDAEAGPAWLVTGSTWSIDVSEATWLTPQDVDELVALMSADYPVLLGVSDAGSESLAMMLGTGDAGGQIMCNRTVEVSGLSLGEDGSVSYAAESFSLANGLTMLDMTLSATIDAETGAMEGLEAQGHVQMSTIPEDLLPLNEGQSACDLAEGLSMPCLACPSEPATGGPADCIEVHVTGLKGTLIEGLALVEITEADCHPECAENRETCDTSGW